MDQNTKLQLSSIAESYGFSAVLGFISATAALAQMHKTAIAILALMVVNTIWTAYSFRKLINKA